MKRSAVIDSTGRYRYLLTREWQADLLLEKLGLVLFVMINPSTADNNADDATVRKCVGFAQKWGFRGLEIVNLFAYRARDQEVLLDFKNDAIGPDNDAEIAQAIARCERIVVAWGKPRWPFVKARAAVVSRQLFEVRDRVMCLVHTKEGDPMHPLYIPYETEPRRFFPEVS